MGRPSLGTQAKSQVGSVRLTAAERDELVRRYGSISDALRALVTKELRGR